MKYAYVQIQKPIRKGSKKTTHCFIILEYFDEVEEIKAIHKVAPYQERYIIIPVYS